MIFRRVFLAPHDLLVVRWQIRSIFFLLFLFSFDSWLWAVLVEACFVYHQCNDSMNEEKCALLLLRLTFYCARLSTTVL